MANPNWCKLVRVEWRPHNNGRKECCDIYEDWERTICFTICVLCCRLLILYFEPCEGEDNDEPTNTVDDRQYPTVTPTDKGIAFTMSAFGATLPIVFGSDKLTGNVFWASSVRKVLINGGAEFYQTVDFALGLCEGEINGILRMWLGEKLILDRTQDVDVNGVAQPSSTGWISGAAIDLTDPDSPLKTNLSDTERQTKIDVYIGSENQLPDPTIVLAEGYDFSPAYRGTAYILFRNFIISSSSIPNIFVELTSNTESPYPRIYGEYAFPIEKFNEPHGTASILADPSYDILHIASRDDSGTATPPNGQGFATFNFNTLELENEMELTVTEGLANLQWNLSRLLPTSGNIFTLQHDGNSGISHIINPHAQVILSSFGPGGGIGDHSITEGLSALNKGTIAFPALGTDIFGQIDVVMGVGNFNRSLGFVEVDQEGQMEFIVNLSNVMTDANARSVFLPISSNFALTTPTFHDGVSCLGTWVYIFNFGASGDAVQFQIGRVKVADQFGNSLLLSASYSEPDTILMDDLRGAGLNHLVSHILVDPSDNCLIVFTVLSGAATTPIVFKYSPFTGNIVWKTSAPGYEDCRGTGMANLTESKYCWITGQGAIYELNMIDGTVKTLETQVSTYDLPLPTVFDQFYNGADNSITYLSNTAGQLVTKIFLDKLTRSTVELGDIVENLLGRVGLLQTDMDVGDVDALTLRGYTISKRQSLRTSFGELTQAFKYDVVESNGRIKYLTRGQSSAATIPKKWFGNVSDDGNWLSAIDENDIARIRKISLTYRDIDRDYKDNVQSIYLPNTSSRTFDNDSSIDVTVPIVLDPDTAKSLAEILLYAKLVYDTTYEATLPGRFSYLDPGDVITVQPDDDTDNDFQLRIRKTSIGADKSVKIEGSKEDPDIYNDVVALFGGAGRYIRSVFKPIPPRIDPIDLDMPYRSDEEAEEIGTAYRIYFTYLNNRPATVVNREVGVTINGTESYTLDESLNFPTWGYVTTPPVFRSSLFSTDNVSAMQVKMMSTTGATLASATHADLLASDQCNLCWVGGELMQFTTVTDDGDGYYTFTGLHRAKFNTSAKFGTQVKGTRFVLLAGADAVLDTGSILTLDVPSDREPSMVAQILVRSSNPLQPKPVRNVRALNQTAWSVASFRGDYSPDDLVLSWQRRTRFNGEMPDDGDETAPINEIDESYVIHLYLDDTTFDTQNASTYLRRVEVTTNSFTYTDAMQVADGFDRNTTDLFAVVYQQGSVTGYRLGTAVKILIPQL